MRRALAAGAPLRDKLAVVGPGHWLALDAGVREAAGSRAQLLPEWEHTAPLPADLTHLGESRLALALCHRDGRIREAAVRRSARCPGLLPLIAIRCADWAEPVRERARKPLCQARDADTAVGLAPLILRVARRDRGTFGVHLLEEVLSRASRGRLAALFVHPDRTVRRFAYRPAIEHRLLRPAELAHAAARDEDTVVQDLGATAALTSLRGEVGAHGEVLAPLLTARGPRTRSAGVTALRRAKPFLGDRSALVRACVWYVVRQHGGDPAPWYRQRCAAPDDPGLPPGAVIGLAECGNRADAEVWVAAVEKNAAQLRDELHTELQRARDDAERAGARVTTLETRVDELRDKLEEARDQRPRSGGPGPHGGGDRPGQEVAGLPRQWPIGRLAPPSRMGPRTRAHFHNFRRSGG
ncbi:MAG TPA: hypothetical protein VFY14_13075 [Streptomyces sp.]|nr:hypothetical protein [Streptomyces sp.]